MTTAQLNVDIFHSLSTIAEDDGLMKRAAKYLKKLAAEKTGEDMSLMTEEQFFAKIEKAEEQIRNGQCTAQKPGESITDMLKRTGHVL